MITETEHFIIEYPENDASIEDVKDALEKGYSKVSEALGYEIKEKTNVIILPDLEAYKKRDNYPYAIWVIGGFERKKGRREISLVSPSVWSVERNNHKYDELWGTISHEVYHLFSSTINDDDCKSLKFLEEGIACHFGNKKKSDSLNFVRENYKPLAEIKGSSSKNNVDSRLKYDEALLMINWLVENHGEKKIAEFVKYRGSFDEKFEKAFGMKFKDAEAQFEKWVKK